MTRSERLNLAASRYGLTDRHGVPFSSQAIERAARVWVAAHKKMWGRGQKFAGESASDIITEHVGDYWTNRERWTDMESLARRRAYELGLPVRKAGPRTRVNQDEESEILRMIREGLTNKQIAQRTGRSQPVISKLRRVA